ncbi:phosphoribosylanthranilate isomerase [bacterium]|nr:phosphoribosylanthranilate isomerase [bacterium]
MNKTPFIQAAGVLDLEDAITLVDAGFTYLGYPLELDFHKEDMTRSEVKAVISALTNKCDHVIITYLSCADSIIELLNFTGTDWVQLHGSISIKEIKKLRDIRPTTKIIKSLVIGQSTQSELNYTVATLSQYVDAFITDTFDVSTGASGATGKTHDWNISKNFVEISSKPIIIAGGLNHENLQAAIETTNAWGVDVHTGIESDDGRKDSALSKAFVKIARESLSKLHA